MLSDPIATIAGGVVVSCQAVPPNPLASPIHMAAMAIAAEQGGAIGIRANGAADIAAIADAVKLPIIGINKVGRDRDPVYITPTFESAVEVSRSGSHILAVDGTPRPRPDGKSLRELIQRIHDELGLPVMADVHDVESAAYAAEAGADLVATTLSGYVGERHADDPDIDLVAALTRRVGVPVVAEGHYRTVDELRQAFAAGAHAVVVGTAITNPVAITRRLVDGVRAPE